MVSLAETLSLALRHHQAGNLRQAEEGYRQVLQTDPQNADAWHLLGVAHHNAGRNQEALECIHKAIALDGQQAIFHGNLGLVHGALGQIPEQLACYDEALRLNPNYAHAHNHRGILLQSQGRLAEAERSYREALRLRPEYPEVYSHLGVVLRAQGRVAEAVPCYREALRLKPEFPEAYNNLGAALRELGQVAEVAACYREAIRLKPDYADVHKNLGTFLQEQGDLAGATACFDRALALAPTDGLKIRAALVLPVIHESNAELLRQRRRTEERIARLRGESLSIEDPSAEAGVTAFELAYQGLNDRDLQASIAALYAQATPSLAYVAPHCAPGPAAPSPNRPIRVGFLSKFFYNHTIGQLNNGLLRQLARPDFQVILFRFPGREDHVDQGMQATADTVVTLPSRLEPARRQIAEQRLDVLFYADIGMDPLTYCLAFARLAPVQCVTWGHPVTTGIPALDYFLSSELLEPDGAEEHYTETLVRLQTLPTYYYRPALPATLKGRRFFGLAEEQHLYGCPQSLFKFHPEFDELLSGILRRDPLGRLVLIEGKHPLWKELLLQRFARTMPDVVDRILFLPRQSREDFLQLNAACDAILDPRHFGSGNTCYEGLALGVPIVTWPGPYLRGRVTLGLYRKMGVLDCVAASADEYVDLAVRLGTEPDFRAIVREKILAAHAVVYEDLAAVRELEQFFRNALARVASR